MMNQASSAHSRLVWNDFGDTWSCHHCGQFGTPYEGDRPEDKLPCRSPQEKDPHATYPYGHQDLKSSDFGYWRCDACGQAGDDWTTPKDYPCTPREKDPTMTDTNLTDQELDALDTEEEFLKAYDMSKYPAQAVAADLAIFTIRNERLAVLLIQRGGHPEKGKWALPGGFVNVTESVDEAASRELQEETGMALDDTYLEQLKTYASPGRDPRGYVVSVAYVALVPKAENPSAGDDASDARFFAVDDVLADFDLAFNHREIIQDGLERVRAKLEYAPIAPKFLDDETFTIPELLRVYEIVWGVKFKHPSNFRRKVQSAKDFLVPVGKKGSPQFEGGRTSDLYRLGEAAVIYPPLRQRQDSE